MLKTTRKKIKKIYKKRKRTCYLKNILGGMYLGFIQFEKKNIKIKQVQ